MRTGWMLDDQKIHSLGIVADLSLSVILAILLIGASILLFFA
jgi:hypothetical protein